MPRVDSAFGRAVQKVAGSEPFLKVAPAVVPRLDRFLNRITGGRFVLSGGMLPSLVLTTTGAKTGRARETPLACMPHGDVIYVVGSNFGREAHPAWTANLKANPEAQVTFRGDRFRVRAHLLPDEEKARIWPELVKHWPNYDKYVARSGGRNLRVFRLERIAR